MTMRRLGVMQEFTRADKRQLRSERFEREAQRTLAEKAATSVTIERDVALAWFDRYYLDAMATIVDQKIEKARIESQAVDANYRGGRASRADRLMVRNTLVELEDRASEFRRRRLNSKVALARWVGDDNSLPLGERPDITVLRWNTQGLHQQLTHHPQLAILEKQEQIASTEAQLAQANKKSDWSWEVGFSQRGSTYSNMVSIGVSIPWQSNSSGRQDRDIAARLAMVEQAKAQREDALRAHVAEVSAMVNEWENGKERLARYTNERMPLTDERIEAVMTAYRGGKANLSDVLVVHRNALEVHLQALQLEWETARLWAQLNFLFPLAKGGAMKHKTMILALATVGVVGTSGYGLYRLGLHQGMNATKGDTPATASAQSTDKVDPSTGKKVLYWHDPMVPGPKFDKPGKSPFMDMQLVPVYADEAGDEGKVSISPRVQQNLGIRTAEVTKGNLTSAIEAVGSVAYNERDVVVIQARSNGYVERLYVHAPLDPVKKGQPLAELYVPDWVAAQEEYLSVKRLTGTGTAELLDAARQRMRLVGMTEDQIRLVESRGKAQPRLPITAPINGVLAELNVREGMTVMAGTPLFRINGLSTIWVNAEVPENVAGQLRPNNVVEGRTPALPGLVFKGKVGAILSEVNAATRTLKARIELANPTGQLVPGMFVTVNMSPVARKDLLLVPSETIIQTGKRSVVMVAQSDGKFMPVDVEIGAEANGQTEIRKGLEAGQRVVTSGQFLIDSEASLKSTSARMSDMPATDSGKPTSLTHHGTGKVEKIDKDEITLSHDTISSLQWGPMTMGFKLPKNGLPKNISVGDSVVFYIRQTSDGTYEITTISLTTGAAK